MTKKVKKLEGIYHKNFFKSFNNLNLFMITEWHDLRMALMKLFIKAIH